MLPMRNTDKSLEIPTVARYCPGSNYISNSNNYNYPEGIQQQFKINIHRLDTSKNLFKNFYVSIKIDGHLPFSTVLAGAPDINLINIQTDKVFYRPNERSKFKNFYFLN